MIWKTTESPAMALIDPSKITNYFTKGWAEYASGSNFSSSFNSVKSTFDSTVNTTQDKKVHLITISELNNCLSKIKGKTPRSDWISYPMIKALSEASKSKLPHLYNTIFLSGHLPHAWKLAIIVPIPKTKYSSFIGA